MGKNVFFGIYHVPPLNDKSLTASYVVPSNLDGEDLTKIKFESEPKDSSIEKVEELLSDAFNKEIAEKCTLYEAICYM